MSRASVIVCTTSFLIGTLATHWIADGVTLWKSPPTDSALYVSAAYYTLLAQAPSWVGLTIGSVALTGVATTLWSLWDGRAGNLMFDSASIFLYGCAFVVYAFSVIPNLMSHFLKPLPFPTTTIFPSELRSPTLDLASSNLVCSVALTGVLVLQAARWWAEGEDDDPASALVNSNSSSRIRPRRRSATPPADMPSPPSSPRVSARRRDGSVRRKRVGSTSSGNTSGRKLTTL